MGMNASAEEVIQNVIESDKDMNDYYGEMEMKMFDGEDLIDHVNTQEYVSKEGKRKILTKDQLNDNEIVALNDGEKMIMYDKGKEEAFEMNVSDIDISASMNPKEQFKMMIESMEQTHEYEIAGEEKVLGYNTYHIKVNAKQEDSLLGDMELWVDQKTWFILKITSETGNSRMDFEYTKLDLSPEFKENVFTIDIPDQINIESIDENLAPDTVTIEEAENALGKPFLVFSDDEVKLNNIQMYDFTKELERYELEMEYTTNDDVPMFFLSIFPAPEEEDIEIKPGEMKVRDNNAEYEEQINSIMWDEDGLRYSIIITNPDITIEEVIELTENMVWNSDTE
ncbi:hypothetical protein CWR48_06265 [Oceanobacillus arenosus]|uniref:MucB/RseB N-terminal domain-containing protein n=1 Tax=Oceanobacillus arenosus TaxID=1229153 RepID=A0A3D8PVW3_9BACI|nr:hypothetical protein [Oceanobacillus arenosus]RDW20290.1 hypothetical protein CWR48_06265 [Oceanobacillus arenosus]